MLTSNQQRPVNAQETALNPLASPMAGAAIVAAGIRTLGVGGLGLFQSIQPNEAQSAFFSALKGLALAQNTSLAKAIEQTPLERFSALFSLAETPVAREIVQKTRSATFSKILGTES